MNADQQLADMDVMPGGCYHGSSWLTKMRVKATERRWYAASYAAGRQEPDYENKWIPHQCGGCRWFAANGLDWGVCWCDGGPMDSKVVFKHGGCVEHSDYDMTQATYPIPEPQMNSEGVL